MSKIVPLISSGTKGPLGVLHLPRLWQKVSLEAAGKIADGYPGIGAGYDSMQLFGPTRQWTARAQDGLEDGIGHEHMVHAFCIRAHMVRRKVKLHAGRRKCERRINRILIGLGRPRGFPFDEVSTDVAAHDRSPFFAVIK